jgi:hypothetical protein
VLREAVRSRGTERSIIICLPRTLDLAVAPPAGAELPPLGFSIGDDEHPEPYFYAARPANSPNTARRIVSGRKLLAATDIAEAAAMLTKVAAP